MRRRPVKIAGAELVAFWRQRFAVLSRRIGDSPTAADAWYWQVQSQILHYLLRRYSGNVTERMTSLPAAAVHAVHVSPEAKPSNSFFKTPSCEAPPRNSQHLLPVLREIEDSNRPRYELLERERNGMIAAKKRQLESDRAQWRDFLEMIPSSNQLLVLPVVPLVDEPSERDFHPFTACASG